MGKLSVGRRASNERARGKTLMKRRFLGEHKLPFGESSKMISLKPYGVSFLWEMRWGEMTNSSILLFSFLSSVFEGGEQLDTYFGHFPSIHRSNHMWAERRVHSKYSQSSSVLNTMSWGLLWPLTSSSGGPSYGKHQPHPLTPLNGNVLFSYRVAAQAFVWSEENKFKLFNWNLILPEVWVQWRLGPSLLLFGGGLASPKTTVLSRILEKSEIGTCFIPLCG